MGTGVKTAVRCGQGKRFLDNRGTDGTLPTASRMKEVRVAGQAERSTVRRALNMPLKTGVTGANDGFVDAISQMTRDARKPFSGRTIGTQFPRTSENLRESSRVWKILQREPA